MHHIRTFGALNPSILCSKTDLYQMKYHGWKVSCRWTHIRDLQQWLWLRKYGRWDQTRCKPWCLKQILFWSLTCSWAPVISRMFPMNTLLQVLYWHVPWYWKHIIMGQVVCSWSCRPLVIEVVQSHVVKSQRPFLPGHTTTPTSITTTTTTATAAAPATAVIHRLIHSFLFFSETP